MEGRMRCWREPCISIPAFPSPSSATSMQYDTAQVMGALCGVLSDSALHLYNENIITLADKKETPRGFPKAHPYTFSKKVFHTMAALPNSFIILLLLFNAQKHPLPCASSQAPWLCEEPITQSVITSESVGIKCYLFSTKKMAASFTETITSQGPCP